MARKKNAQPKRRLEATSQEENGNHSKRPKLPTHYLPGRRTTNVIPADPTHPALATLPTFLTQFQSRLPQMTKEYVEALRHQKGDSNGWYKGFRLITGNRMEIKVLSEWLLEEFSSEWNPVALIQYAQAQAQKDERIVQNILQNHGRVQFSEWSMIVNASSCQAQTIHIDVPANNYQFGLVLQDGVPGTMVLSNHEIGPQTPSQLLCSSSGVWQDAPEPLKECILQNTIINSRMQHLLDAYGPLLIPRADLEMNMVGGGDQRKKPYMPSTEEATGNRSPSSSSSIETAPTTCSFGLKCGDMICTAGGIPHAGPATQEFRVVVFAAAAPTKESLYNVDEQYYAHSAILFAIQLVWDGLLASLESKRWLLHKLAKVVHNYETGPIENHNYVSKAFTTLMHQMANVFQKDAAEETEDGAVNGAGETRNIKSADSSSMERVISTFLQANATKSEQTLFQYRPKTIWQTKGTVE
ncbi:MAG: hypothetical protein SGBAC_004504 [Bacillariaceae sp.]